MAKIKVLIIDDSALMRSTLSKVLSDCKGIEVVGTAIDPLFAIDKIKSTQPDVITLDIEMPRMDGLTFLEKLMRRRPTPVIVISALTEKGSEITLKALSLGAIDFIQKPKVNLAKDLQNYQTEISEKIRIAAKANLVQPIPIQSQPKKPTESTVSLSQYKLTNQLIAIGASTGGTQALETILRMLPATMPGIVITQHMPAKFTRSFADRLNDTCELAIKEAETGDIISTGKVLIAPGDAHLVVQKSGAKYVCQLDYGKPVNRHIPSVDVMFDSVAATASKNCIGVLLTGMGKDGAAGLFNIRQNGGITLAQNEASSVVFGMPKAAIELGAADFVLHLNRIAEHLIRLNSEHRNQYKLTF